MNAHFSIMITPTSKYSPFWLQLLQPRFSSFQQSFFLAPSHTPHKHAIISTVTSLIHAIYHFSPRKRCISQPSLLQIQKIPLQRHLPRLLQTCVTAVLVSADRKSVV